jgi:hypothetical protein
MAIYSELYDIQNNDKLLHQTQIAIVVAAEAIRTDAAPPTNHAQRLVWAKEAFQDPKSKVSAMLWAMIAANNAADLVDITGATDATVQAAVNNAVNVLATG